MLEDAERFADEDEARMRRAEAVNNLASFVYGLKNQLRDSDGLGGKVSTDDKKRLSVAIEETEEWINEHEKTASTEDFENKLNGGFPFSSIFGVYNQLTVSMRCRDPKCGDSYYQ